MPELSPEAELAWRLLWRHLDRSQHFTLVFLVVDEQQALDEVCWRLSEYLTERGAALEVLAPMTRSSRWVDSLEGVLVFDAERVESRSPVLLSLFRQPLHESEDRLRDEVLVALNVQRSNLERGFQRPLLIAVPKAYLPQVWSVAPDLWTIRGLVVELSSPRVLTRGLGEPRSIAIPEVAVELAEVPSISEWRRVAGYASSEPESVSPFLAHVAAEDALDLEQFDDAREISEQGLVLARTRAATRATYERRHDVAILLEAMGEVLTSQRKLDEAERAFVEALQIRRELLREAGDQPASLRDVFLTLENLSDILREQGRVGEAAQLSEEATAIRRRLEALERRS